MSAEILRRAASLIRERALAVSYPSPWAITGAGTCDIRCNGGRNYVASTYGGVGTDEAAATHIASWHPAVALAVARWLEAESHEPETEIWDGITTGGPGLEALAVARAYLGDQP